MHAYGNEYKISCFETVSNHATIHISMTATKYKKADGIKKYREN